MTETQRGKYYSIIRGYILKILAPGYPNPTDMLVIRTVLSDWGYNIDTEDLMSFVAYLQERGLVSMRSPVKHMKLVSITADGLDVLDGRKCASGVLVS